MNIAKKTLSEITSQATQTLYNEIGIVDTIRFLNQFTTGFGDYTEEREELLKDLSLQDILTEIKQSRDKS